MKEILSGLEVKGELRVSKDPVDDLDVVTKRYLENATQDYEGELNAHVTNMDNPHKVTAEQLKLGAFVGYTPETMPITPQMQAELDGKADIESLASVYRPMGSVATYADLPKPPDVHVGDVYDVRETGMNYVWVVRDGVAQWDELGLGIDIKNYYTKAEVDERDLALQNRIDAESVARCNADRTLEGLIEAEETARNVAIQGVYGRIDDEVEMRKADDAAIRKSVTDEARARSTKDGELEASISAEAVTRADADTALSNRVTPIESIVNELPNTYVKKAGDTMTGNLTIEKSDVIIKAKHPSMAHGGSWSRYIRIVAQDMNGVNIGEFSTENNETKTSSDVISRYTVNGTNVEGRISAVVTSTGDKYATAPSPTSKTDNSEKIATTAWVNQTDFLVHSYGSETIGGTKTFTYSPIMNIPISAGSGGSGIYRQISFADNDGAFRGGIRTEVGNIQTVVSLRAYDMNGLNPKSIEVVCPSTGDGYALAPTTPDDADSNEIATADWVLSKLDGSCGVKRMQITGDGTLTAFSLTHGLGATTVLVQVYLNGVLTQPAVSVAENTVTLTFTTAPAIGEIYDVIIIG